MLSRFSRKLFKYLFVLRWLVRDLLWQFRKRITMILAFRGAGLVLQLGAFGLLAYYARLLETDATVAIFDEAHRARESVQLLVMFAVTSFVALTIGSIFEYFSVRMTEFLAGDYEQSCSRRVLEISGRLSIISVPEVDHLEGERLLLALLKTYPRMLRRMARMVLATVVPSLLLVIIVFPVLFYLNAWLTLLVLMIVAMSLAGYYHLSIQAGMSSLDYERTGKPATLAFRHALGQLLDRTTPLNRRELRQALRQSPIRRNQRALLSRLLTENSSRFISDLTTAIVLTLILIVLGGHILVQGEGWTALVVYLVALRYSMNQTRGLLTSLTKVNRFFPQANAYSSFVTACEQQMSEAGTGEPASSFEVECDTRRALPGSRARTVLKSGDRVAVLCRSKATRFQVFQLYQLMFSDDDNLASQAWFQTQLAGDEVAPRATALRNTHDEHPTLQLVVTEDRIKKAEAIEYEESQEASPIQEQSSEDGTIRIMLIRRLDRITPLQSTVVIIVDDDGVRWIGNEDGIPAVADQLHTLSYTDWSTGAGYDDFDDDDD